MLRRLKLNSMWRVYKFASPNLNWVRSAANKPKPTKDATRVPGLLGGSNANFVEELYRSWVKDAKSVHVSWDKLFRNNGFLSEKPGGAAAMEESQMKEIEDHLGVQNIIRSYQSRGHLVANLDPLDITNVKPIVHHDGKERRANENVLRQHSGFFFGKQDMTREFKLPTTTFIGGDRKFMPLGEILDSLERVYCGTIGVEFMYIPSLEKCNWIRQKFETPGIQSITHDEKHRIMLNLTRSAVFEMFLNKKYPSEKRFGLEGCEIVVPALNRIIDIVSENGVDSVTIGMAHRGRLNVLANVCHKRLRKIFTQFIALYSSVEGSGDVKYHLGTSIVRNNPANNKNVRVTIVANPSHLEAVNSVVLGKVRAEQFYRGDPHGNKSMSLLIHGDAAFSGQGVVFECLHFCAMPEYTTHGTIHVVINNQIGFTTDPRFSRASPCCTDIARVVNAPIFHVNADDPEAVMYVCKVAAEWRTTFHKDVVIDLVCYRRFGHNETDEPMFTQPLMYQKIRQHPKLIDMYAKKLIADKIITQEEIDHLSKDYVGYCEKQMEVAKQEEVIKYHEWLDSPWPAFFQGIDPTKMEPTSIKEETLLHIAKIVSTPPPADTHFVLHNGIKRLLANRNDMVNEGIADWALAECFAFGSLLKDGVFVRLSGQDVERGTFSHRHHVYHHQKIDKATYVPLRNLYVDQAHYSVSNSSLSEYAVMGFEHGFSIANPKQVVIWEAQFGDFANTAQCIIDQFLASGQAKWTRQSGMVVFLPHGAEGQGPEHSSARLERYLQLSSDDPDSAPEESCDYELCQLRDINWIVANCTTPANFFHILRRQVALPFRKPLIIMTPKSLLRHPKVISKFGEFTGCSAFKRMIPDDICIKNPNSVCKVIFCSGKVYYDLHEERHDRQMEDIVALIRIEQICPFPYDLVVNEMMRFRQAELIWLQEEPKNQGSWTYVQPRLETALAMCKCDIRSINYIGRAVSATTATGNKATFLTEVNNILTEAFGELTDEEKSCIKKRKEEEAKEAAEKQAKKKAQKAQKAEASTAPNPKPADTPKK